METSAVLWRCRRGIREMDLLLQQFVQNHFSDLPPEEKLVFEKLLDETDLDILDWIMEKKSPPDSFRRLVAKIRETNSPVHPDSN